MEEGRKLMKKKKRGERKLGYAGTDVEAVDFDFELEDDDLMDEEAGGVGDAPPPKLKSAITGGSASTLQRKTKGRGFREETHDRSGILGGRDFESLGSDGGPGPLRCQQTISSVVKLWKFEFTLGVEFQIVE
ncbi:hypothetical protein ACFE04_005344 [Oxalis oulophora]